MAQEHKKTMRITKALVSILFCFATLSASAQVERQATLDTHMESEAEGQATYATAPAKLEDYKDMEQANLASEDSTRYRISLPYYMASYPTLFTSWAMTSPFGWGMPWDLHEGMNVQIDLGVMVGFGKNNPFHGASFFTDLSLAYAKSIGTHWTLVAGGTLSRFRFLDKNVFAGNAFTMANYKFNDHWSASVFASYNKMPEGTSIYCYGPLNEQSIRIGGEVTYKFNEKTSVSLGVSHEIPVGNNDARPWRPMRQTNINSMK